MTELKKMEKIEKPKCIYVGDNETNEQTVYNECCVEWEQYIKSREVSIEDILYVMEQIQDYDTTLEQYAKAIHKRIYGGLEND